MLQAANLRGTIELDSIMDLDVQQATSLMDAQEYVSGVTVMRSERDTGIREWAVTIMRSSHVSVIGVHEHWEMPLDS